MPELAPHPDLGQLRRQAKDLLRAARRGDTDAVSRVRALSDRLILDSAQLVMAREYGFASWARLKTEVERREILDARDLTRLTALLAEHPELAVERMRGWCDHRHGASPLGYVAMLRYDTLRGVWRDVPGTGAVARALLAAGAPVEGDPADAETPLMTAASYGDAEVARVLVDAGGPTWTPPPRPVPAGYQAAPRCATPRCSGWPMSPRSCWRPERGTWFRPHRPGHHRPAHRGHA